MSTTDSKERKDDTPRAKSGLRPTVTIFGPVVLMAIFGAYLGLTSTDETREAYLSELRGGLLFTLAPIVLAIVLFVLYRLIRSRFRA